MSGFVYFVGAASDGDEAWVKIGFTSGDVYARRAALQTGCPFSLEVLAYAHARASDERFLHERFSAFRGYGEWFALEGFLQTYVHSVARLCAPYTPAPTLWTDVWHAEHVR